MQETNVLYFKAFENKCFIYNNGKGNLSKFDARSDEGILVSYSSIGKAYLVYNKCTKVIGESIHIVFDELTMILLVHLYLTSFS